MPKSFFIYFFFFLFATMYKIAKIPRMAGYIPALPMDLKTTPMAFASGTLPYGYVNIKFLQAQKNNPGPGTWMPSTTSGAIPFVSRVYMTKRRREVKPKKRRKPQVSFPPESIGIPPRVAASSKNAGASTVSAGAINTAIAGASPHTVGSIKKRIKALKKKMKDIERTEWGRDAFSSISSGIKIKANVTARIIPDTSMSLLKTKVSIGTP